MTTSRLSKPTSGVSGISGNGSSVAVVDAAEDTRFSGASCATGIRGGDSIVAMKHGSGGRAMRRLIRDTLTRGFLDAPVDGVGLAAFDDGAAVRIAEDKWLVVTTDSHVVHPIVFPGGDIGRLSIAGTVNDLAMMGVTEPTGLTCAVILEEGFPIDLLEEIQQSMQEACREAGVTVLTGDTKVMGRGEVDGIVINTTGVGITGRVVPDSDVRAGDWIIVTGSIGDHGVALMATRNGFEMEGDLRSDVAPINTLVRRALDAEAAGAGRIVAMKDPTRGGLASALYEMAEKGGVGIMIREYDVPITESVRAAADMLGLDPFHIANEGKAVIVVRGSREDAELVVAALRSHPLGERAAVVGEAMEQHRGRVILDTGLGKRIVAEPEGEPVPRIC
jgi:hydrogenase expression/formation protein HypE